MVREVNSDKILKFDQTNHRLWILIKLNNVLMMFIMTIGNLSLTQKILN